MYMNRRRIIRWELMALAVVMLLLIFRAMSGPPAPRGLVVMSDIAPHRLAHVPFSVEQPVSIAIEAVGSYEPAGGIEKSSNTLASYGWIIRRHDREPVWAMNSDNTTRGRGLLATVNDTLHLEPGIYDAYFSSFGNSFFSGGDRSIFRRIFNPKLHWQNDSDEWMMVLRSVGQDQGVVRRIKDEKTGAFESKKLVIWAAAPLKSNEERSWVFEVNRPVPIDVYSVGEWNTQPKDYGWIEEIKTGERLFEMTRENTVPAGGVVENRSFRGVVQLDPGIYRAVFTTDRTHAYRDWQANPPYDPGSWGLTLSVVNAPDTSAIDPFDPWETREPILRITEVPDENLRSAQFVVKQNLNVMIHAVGEMHEGGRYDYAWITNDQEKETVWEMRWDNTLPAGGAEKNRAVSDFVTLEPGTYTVYYQTDDSHAYGSWNADQPDHPERWGVTIFPVSPSFDPSSIHFLQPLRIVEGGEHDRPHRSDRPHRRHAAPLPPPIFPDGEILVHEAPLPNGSDVESSFELSESARLRIYAVGEITLSGRYDYGWIERADTGEHVWDMTFQNTSPAGGDDRNRRFVGEVLLQPGQYIVHFHTDLSHAYGDFGDRSPADAEYWGITIMK